MIQTHLLRGVQITTAHTEVGGGADHAAGQPQGVVTQDGLGGTIVVLVGDGRDEALHVQLGRTGLLAWSIRTFQTSREYYLEILLLNNKTFYRADSLRAALSLKVVCLMSSKFL